MTRQAAERIRPKERLDFLIRNEYRVVHYEAVFWLAKRNGEGEEVVGQELPDGSVDVNAGYFNSPLRAIDAAIRAERMGKKR